MLPYSVNKLHEWKAVVSKLSNNELELWPSLEIYWGRLLVVGKPSKHMFLVNTVNQPVEL